MEEQGGGFWPAWCKPEWEVIAGAPRAFSISLTVLTVAVGLLIYGMFKVNLDLKADRINDLTANNLSLKAENDDLKAQVSKDYSAGKTGRTSDYSSNAKTKIPIIGKTYMNESVQMDGFSYTNCKFINVTFVFKGEAPFDFSYNTIDGHRYIQGSPAMEDMIMFMKEIGMLKPEFAVNEH